MLKLKSPEKRKFRRFFPLIGIPVDFEYNFEANIEISQTSKRPEGRLSYHATTRNISAEGICFYSSRRLKKGDRLDLKFFIPGINIPVYMQGRVCWSKSALKAAGSPDYDTGIHLTLIEGHSVRNSVYFDDEYNLYWSDVLESILGKFKTIHQKRKDADTNEHTPGIGLSPTA
jgi:hypothetical protein